MKAISIKLAIAAAICVLGVPGNLSGQELPQPLPEHELLKKDVGEWDAEVKIWIPGADEPMISKGTDTTTMLGEMWSISVFKGEFGGQEFKGHGTTGYDPGKKKYIGTWVDSMLPYMSTMEGTYDKDTETMTWMTKGTDPTGNPQIGKNVVQYKDDDTRIFTMYTQTGEGKDKFSKEVQITYKRK